MDEIEKAEIAKIKAETEKLKAETKAIRYGIWLKWYTAFTATLIGSTSIAKIIKEITIG